jgi:AraC-like DNA-binding protein
MIEVRSMPFVTFSSDSLSAALDDHGRFQAWRQHYMAMHGRLDLNRPDDRPFSLRFSFATYGAVGVGQFDGTVSSVARTPHHVAKGSNDTLCLFLNRGRDSLRYVHGRCEEELDAGGMTLFRDWEPAVALGGPLNRMLFVPIPRDQLAALVADPEDIAGRALDTHRPASRHLARYLALLSQRDETDEDEGVCAHIGTTLLDLIALALGASKDVAHTAKMRGLRAARAQDVIAQIAAGFTDPTLSPTSVAAALGFSARYVQELLHETGKPFTARVMELRLQRARSILSDQRSGRLRIAEIAHACGFNEVPYFNRCFRRRFGESPSSLRSG